MTRLKIKNCLLERYCNTVFWINNEKYILRPASEIEIDIFEERIEIIFSIYFSQSKKIIVNCNKKEEIVLKLKYNYTYYIINMLFVILFFINVFVPSKISIIFYFFVIPFFSYFIFFISKYIELSEN